MTVKGIEVRAVLPDELAFRAGGAVASAAPLDTGDGASAAGDRAGEGRDACGTGNIKASKVRAVNRAEDNGKPSPVGGKVSKAGCSRGNGSHP